MAKKYCYVVFSNPTSEREDEYNKWYNEVHLPDVLAVPGFVSARRFKIAQDDNKLPASYLALYEMETDDPETSLQDLASRAGTPTMMLSDALDVNTALPTLFAQVSDTVYPRK
jgi:hypothetical protein